MMPRYFILTFILIFLVMASCTPLSISLPPQTYTFVPSSAALHNPERGFYSGTEFTGTNFTKDNLSSYVETGNTLVYLNIRLDDYRNRDLSIEYLNDLDAYFQLAHVAGIKFIARFYYNFGPYPNSDPDAPLGQVLRHIKQLTPIVEKNKDVIAWLEAGFIGAWGEWHSSTNGLDTPENSIIIRDALFAAFPKDRAILFRYPKDFINWYPEPLTEAQAFTQINQARLGHHNDCFLANEDDKGTYALKSDGTLTRDEWQAYISQMTRFVPMAGETCTVNPPRSDCKTALHEMELLHWTALNQDWQPDVIQRWKDQGCYTEIRNRLGYRLTLFEAKYKPKIQAGGEFQVSISLENTGFTSPLLSRPVYLMLVNQDGIPAYSQLIPVDPRRWEPGVHTFEESITLPADLSAGEYRVVLWLPDPAPDLQNDPRYAIRFANENVWNTEGGWNVLGNLLIASAN